MRKVFDSLQFFFFYEICLDLQDIEIDERKEGVLDVDECHEVVFVFCLGVPLVKCHCVPEFFFEVDLELVDPLVHPGVAHIAEVFGDEKKAQMVFMVDALSYAFQGFKTI